MSLKDDRVEQCLRSCESELQVWGQRKRKHESHESCVCNAGFSACGCQKKSVVYETECKHVAVQKGKQNQNHRERQRERERENSELGTLLHKD